MPVVGTGNLDTAEYVLNLARAFVNDAAQTLAGNLLSDSRPYTFPELNACYRELQSDLQNEGYEYMFSEQIMLMMPGAYTVDPQVQTYINYTNCSDGLNVLPNPHLPPDLGTPLRLWERPTGTIQDYQMVLPVNDGLPSRPQSGTLQQWDWRGGQIYFVGTVPGQFTDLRLRYVKQFPDLVDGTSIVQVPWADRALAFLMGRTYGAQRGSPMWNYMDGNYVKALTSIVQGTARKRQRGSHRRRPYGSSNMYWLSGYGQGGWS